MRSSQIPKCLLDRLHAGTFRPEDEWPVAEWNDVSDALLDWADHQESMPAATLEALARLSRVVAKTYPESFWLARMRTARWGTSWFDFCQTEATAHAESDSATPTADHTHSASIAWANTLRQRLAVERPTPPPTPIPPDVVAMSISSSKMNRSVWESLHNALMDVALRDPDAAMAWWETLDAALSGGRTLVAIALAADQRRTAGQIPATPALIQRIKERLYPTTAPELRAFLQRIIPLAVKQDCPRLVSEWWPDTTTATGRLAGRQAATAAARKRSITDWRTVLAWHTTATTPLLTDMDDIGWGSLAMSIRAHRGRRDARAYYADTCLLAAPYAAWNAWDDEDVTRNVGIMTATMTKSQSISGHTYSETQKLTANVDAIWAALPPARQHLIWAVLMDRLSPDVAARHLPILAAARAARAALADWSRAAPSPSRNPPDGRLTDVGFRRK